MHQDQPQQPQPVARVPLQIDSLRNAVDGSLRGGCFPMCFTDDDGDE